MCGLRAGAAAGGRGGWPRSAPLLPLVARFPLAVSNFSLPFLFFYGQKLSHFEVFPF